jgi:F-type H+-transporting ATPase subunit delta
MSEAVVAKRYADALFQLATEKNIVEKLIAELDVVKEVFQTNERLIELLLHPRVQHEEKMKLVDDAFGKCDKAIVHLIKMLVERHRIQHISEIVAHFTKVYHEANREIAATVYSVRLLSNDELKKVEESLMNQLDKTKVKIENIIDPTVLGGLKIRVGNTIYDGSVRGKLNRFKEKIVSV